VLTDVVFQAQKIVKGRESHMAHWNGLCLWEVLRGITALLLLEEMTALMLPLFLLL